MPAKDVRCTFKPLPKLVEANIPNNGQPALRGFGPFPHKTALPSGMIHLRAVAIPPQIDNAGPPDRFR